MAFEPDKLLSGYSGVFKQPIDMYPSYGPSAYCMRYTDNTTIVAIPLTPEFYLDLFRILRKTDYHRVILFIPALDALFLSTIFNLYMSLNAIKPDIEIYFPKAPPIPTSSVFSLNLRVQNNWTDTIGDWIPSVEYVKSDPTSVRDMYDIIIRDGVKTIYISQYFNSDGVKLTNLCSSPLYDEIHMPFNSTLYGGMTYRECVRLLPSSRNKLRIHSYTSKEEYELCRGNDHIKKVKVIYNDLV